MLEKTSHPRAKTPHPVDAYVGTKIQFYRQAAGVTQQELGDVLGLTFQQIQKYESGMNRCSASALLTIATRLQIPIEDFFPLPDDTPRPIDLVTHPEAIVIGQAYERLAPTSRTIAKAFINRLAELEDCIEQSGGSVS